MDLKTIYNLSASIGTESTGTPPAWTYAALGAGIENIAEALNESVQQYFFLNAGGFANNHVTGMAPTYTFTGHRVMGDAAQDYIFSKKYTPGADRASSFKLEYVDGNGATVSVVADCTIANIQEWSGASNEDSSISFEVRFDGAPTVTVTPAY